MTDLNLADLREKLERRARKLIRLGEKATAGPWRKFRSDYGNDTIAIMKGDEPASDDRGYHVSKWPEIITWMGFDGADTSQTKRHIDARFLVAAVNFVRDDLPHLLDLLDAKEAREREMERAIREAKVLIDEINERAPSRAFYGISQGLHGKLCTIRATLARLALSAGGGADA